MIPHYQIAITHAASPSPDFSKKYIYLMALPAVLVILALTLVLLARKKVDR
jgi:hypothetical protein